MNELQNIQWKPIVRYEKFYGKSKMYTPTQADNASHLILNS